MKRFEFKVALHILIIFLLSIGSCLLYQRQLWFSTTVCILLLIGVGIHLYRIQFKQIALLRQLTDGLRYNDITQNLHPPFKNKMMDEWAQELSNALKDFRGKLLAEEVKHQYYESLLNKVDTVVLVTDASGHIEWMNQAAVAHLGQISQLPDVLQEASISNDMSMIRIEQNGIVLEMAISCTTFATLCTRAAIEGGLSTTKSYCLGDAYIKSFFLAKTASEVSAIKNQMYKDFVTRVHNCRNNPQYSKMVQGSRDYIELHLAEPISIETLATRLGYSKYYLSTRFKKEIGCSVNDYIKFVRIERAKRLLSTTEKNISEIAENTGFASRNFFASTFKQCVGKTPAQYRKEMLNT